MGRIRGRDWLRGLILSLCVISGAVVITLNFRPLYRLDMRLFSISEESGYPEDEVYANYKALIAYNNLGGGETLELPTMPVSETARIHFAEVKRIFIAIELAFLASLPVSVLLVFMALRRKEYGWLLVTGLFCGVLPLALGLLVAAGWEQFFIGFHEMVFSNDYWIFDPAYDPVILILPDGFFLHCAVMILSVWLVSGIICLILWKKCCAGKIRRRPGTEANGAVQ